MSTLAMATPPGALGGLFTSREAWERPWTSTMAFLAVLAGLCAFGLAVDPRTLGGANVWLKPFKFSVSTLVHIATLLACARLLAPEVRAGRFMALVGIAATVSVLFEMSWITLQAARAEHSHFNLVTPFTRTMYSLMGFFAVTLIACAAVIGVLVARARTVSAPLRAGVGIGLVVGFVLTLVIAGKLGSSQGHFVGVHPPGAPVVPFFGWSGVTGDLRPAHFLALHTMQVVPLVGLWLARRSAPGERSEGHAPARAVWAVVVFATVWTVATVAVFVQALAERPLIPLG